MFFPNESIVRSGFFSNFAALKLLLLKVKKDYIELNPWQYLILSFFILIALGTLLLKLPFVTHTNGLTFIDSVFTSTSAVCVTGLTTVPTSGFNWVGKGVLLLMMQLGAIGIMTLSSSLILALRGKISLKDKISFFRTQEDSSLHDINNILRFVVFITFVTELIGAAILTIGFSYQGLPFIGAVEQGVFHSVSAFCNAGFSTYDTSLVGMNALIKYTVMGLIIVGGIGYHVIYEVFGKFNSKAKYSLHTKVVLFTTIILIVGGALLIYIFETGHISITDSLFQSVTARTAGFNTVDITKMHYLSLFFMSLLMFIGASPGSTGGGIKTTTFFIVMVALIKILRGNNNVVVFNRYIPNKVILKSFAIMSAYFMVAFIATLALLYHNDDGFLKTLFEIISAIGTVGLSLGVSAQVGIYGKIILILTMFIGRVGPASVAMLISSNDKNINIKYPEESIY